MERRESVRGEDLVVRRAVREDTEAAQAAYGRIIEHLGRTVDFPHWHTADHPRPEEVEAWVAAGDLYLAVVPAAEPATAVAGVVVLDHEAPAAYREAKWAVDAVGDEVLVVHALGVVPEFLRTGVARLLVDAALRVAAERGCRAVRLDTYVENVPARELYTRYGFTDLGVHTVRYEGIDIDQFHLFEYVL